ncbi:deoxyribose-phosphate aldolase [Ulvibacter litoralis]|uniref:Deoxyribose-phosphate aldolase n=1 Tax=Ulvibacter litoralis TaxID=227084 RepID=A0A1G7I941_9FLAO|nr:deoxyribose-phosphate aldolase [Ulvibacter litoralis]GHC62100.1 2-deoxyribose-5-phosphate aldolase [Ulvibacter litoralis]SDF09240.1 deoxyribose-phosphate aldolase [Ulvibacter litoralis]
MKNLHTYIEHTLLKSTATTEDITNLCNEAIEYNFYGVCVNTCYVTLAANTLKDHSAKVIATVGFPLGANSTKSKIEETKQAIKEGADEIDMVLNVGFLKSQLTKSVSAEIKAIKKVMGRRILKVIIETCYLSQAEMKLASEIARLAGADFVKTSTGFGSRGATVKDIITIKKKVGDHMQIKASGGIKTASQCIELIEAGASRIGTSNGIGILYDHKNHEA